MLQKPIGYGIKKFQRFYRVPEKMVIFKRIKNYKTWAMNFNSGCFVKNLFLIQYFDSLCKDSKRNWISTLLSNEIYGLF